jgi:hypothetical protein
MLAEGLRSIGMVRNKPIPRTATRQRSYYSAMGQDKQAALFVLSATFSDFLPN